MTTRPTRTGKILNSILRKDAAGKSGKSKYISTNEMADKIAMVESRRVFVITGSSNFLKIREAGKTSTPSFYSKLFKQSLN